ncbi:MAG: FtsH protease activity modulator HflK [Gammaproteobacteria bacterium]
MVWNEPGGNNKGSNGGPPDLESFLRDLFGLGKKRRKANPFANHSQGNGNGGSNGSSGRSSEDGGNNSPINTAFLSKVLIFIIVLFVLATVYQGIFMIPEGSRAVITRLGAYHRELNPGLQFMIPWLEQREILNIQRIESITVPRGRTPLMLTNDENLVHPDVRIQYQLRDPEKFLFNSSEPLKTFTQAAESAVRQVIGRSPLDDVLTEKRSEIQAAIDKELRNTLNLYDIGISVVSVNLQSAKAPDQVKDAFDDVIRAREDQERFINEAQTYSEKIKANAEGKSQRMLSEAEAYKNETLAQARGNVDKFKRLLPEYQAAPEVTKQRLYLETMEQIFSKSKKVLVDKNQNGNSPILYLPLEPSNKKFGLSEMKNQENS